jgi:putative ABC transport system permease protein
VRSLLLLTFPGLSIFLLVFLRSIVVGMRSSAESAAPDRLMVQSGIGPFAELPGSYRDTLTHVPGVLSVCRWSWFGGTYRDPSNFFPIMAVDLETCLAQYREIVLTPDAVRAVASDRRGCVVGAALAHDHGWRVGNVVPIMGTQYPKSDGTAWEFTIRGIYRSADPTWPEKAMLFHWQFLEDTRRTLEFSAETAGLVTLYSVKIAPGHQPAVVAASIDAVWASGPVRTLTQTERQHRAEEVGLVGSLLDYLSIIGGIVVLATILSAGNAMGIATADRRREAGLLLALGFPDHVIAGTVVAEAVVLVGLGGALGTAASWAIVPLVRESLGFAGYHLEPATVALAFAASALVGLLGGLVPGIRLGRVRPVDVFRDAA